MRRLPILAAFSLMFSAVLAGPAAAGIYSVAGVKVDVTAPSAAQARAAGFDQAHELAFARLARRLTPAGEWAAKGPPALSAQQIDALVANVDIEKERPVGAHYIAQLTVSFDPRGARAALEGLGYHVVEARTAPLLVVASAPSAPPAVADAWRAAWVEGGYGNELAPLVPASAPAVSADWSAVQGQAAAAGAAGALYANLRLAGGVAYADLTEIDANARRSLGAVNVSYTPGGEARAVQALADAASAKVQDEWKRAAAGSGALASAQTHMVASALYANQGEWRRLQKGLEGAAKTILSGISVEAVSKAGAMVAFSYSGGRDQLAAELRRNGVALADSPQGPTLTLAPGGA